MIKVNDLSFSYTKKPFIKGMNFTVEKGEIFGFLGPSGAGKTTLQKILIGMISTYHGSVKVNGFECGKVTNKFYESIGVDFEYSTLYEKLTARQNLDFFASLYRKKPKSIEKLLRSVGLQNDSDKRVSEYSKGMRSRLNFIKTLIHDPVVLFLDEPTNGLDPTNNQMMKELILAEKSAGKTIILTTHNMHDAAELCDRVAFIVNGTICALDTPRNLIMSRGATQISYTYQENTEKKGYCQLNKVSEDLKFKQLISENRLTSVHSSEPTLNDIFIDVTGRTLV